MFVDTARIDLKAGRGGDGAVAFRREKFEPAGGPAGGDGGRGGNIIIVSDVGERTLSDFRYRRYYTAENGEHGRNKKQYGKAGADLYLKVPVGTVVKDFETGAVIHDFKKSEDEFIICKGGRGGRGNAKFKTSTRQAPHFAEPGVPGQERSITLEIKLLADVGLVGLPNVGKSTILSILTRAKPEIANYHFTTLNPNLGVVDLEEDSFVMADIPGLIEGASKGIGLGHEFLKHVERTAVLVHVLDMAGSEGRDPLVDYQMIRQELASYNAKLLDKEEIIVANKKDLPGFEKNLSIFKETYPDKDVISISAATTENIRELKYHIAKVLKNVDLTYEIYDDYYIEIEEEERPAFEISKMNGFYLVEGPLIDDLVYRTNFDQDESLKHFQKVLYDKGIIDELVDLGIQDGDTVSMGEIEFEFTR